MGPATVAFASSTTTSLTRTVAGSRSSPTAGSRTTLGSVCVVGLNESASYATCDAPDCQNSIAIPNARVGDAEAALNWVLGEGWGVGLKDDETYCPHHPETDD